MKKLILIIAITFFAPSIEAQDINLLLEKYLPFVNQNTQTVSFETLVEYNSGKKSIITFGNKITSTDLEIPELNVSLKAPAVEDVRLIDGVIWVGSSPSTKTDVKKLDILRKTVYNEANEVVDDTVYDETPSLPVLVDDEFKALIQELYNKIFN